MQHLATKIAKLETHDNRSTSAQSVRRYPGPPQPRSSATRPHPRDVNETRPPTDRHRTPSDRRPPVVDRRHNTQSVDYRSSFNTGQRPRQRCVRMLSSGSLRHRLSQTSRIKAGKRPDVSALTDHTGNEQRPTVNLVIFGIKVTALVDTGAT